MPFHNAIGQKEYDHYVKIRNLENCFYRGQWDGVIPRWIDISGLDVDSKISLLVRIFVKICFVAFFGENII